MSLSSRRPPRRPEQEHPRGGRSQRGHGRADQRAGEQLRVRGEQGKRSGRDRRDGGGGRDARRLRMPPEEIPQRPPYWGRGHGGIEQSFKCGHCKRFIGPLPSGGHHRNHCPFCLYSRHVDATRSGDRASTCGGLMRPIGAFQRPNGEHVIVHLCLTCGFERFNRIAADDDFDLVLALPVVPPRSARPAGDESESGGTGGGANVGGQGDGEHLVE